MTLDGVCDHTKGVVDEQLHQHYAELIGSGGVILYGRKTYQLMQFWQELLTTPSGVASMDGFARVIHHIPKLIFSNTLLHTGWSTATLASKPLINTVIELKQQPGKPILVGSRSLIIQLLNSHLVDEFQICIHPILAGQGQRLFEQMNKNILLKLTHTKLLPSGAIVLYYEPASMGPQADLTPI